MYATTDTFRQTNAWVEAKLARVKKYNVQRLAVPEKTLLVACLAYFPCFAQQPALIF